MDEFSILLPGGLALLLLIASLSIYHQLFQRLRPAAPRAQQLQMRVGYPAMGLALSGPFWWLSENIRELTWARPTTGIIFQYFAAMCLAEVGLCFLMDRADGPRVPDALQRVLRLGLYGVTSLVPITLFLGLPVLDRQFQEKTGSIVLLYLALHVIYTYIFKWMSWRHPLALALRKRLRIWAYLLVMALVTYFGLHHLGVFDRSARTMAMLYFETALGVLTGIFWFEALLAGLFDYYYAVVRGSDVPHLFYDLARGIGYLAIVGLCAVLILHRDISSLLLGSAVISVAVGFALQETLGHFIAGLALRLARPFVLGDKIEVLAQAGSVQRIDWRSTLIVNIQGDVVIIPNSKLAQEVFINHSSPTPNCGRFIDVGVHYRHPPHLVKQVLLDACRAVPEVLDHPGPEVYALSFDDSAVQYRLRLFIGDFSERFRIESKVRESIWYYFNRNGLEMPYPHRQILQVKPEDVDLEAEIRKLLDTVDFFAELDDDDLSRLAHRARLLVYAAGERVFEQGQEGNSFYIIKAGTAGVEATDGDGHVFLSAEMHPGKYFGEMALLTGEPRSATVTARTDLELFRLGKEDLRVILTGNPKVEEVISKVLALRKLATIQAQKEAEEGKAARAQESTEHGDRIDLLAQQFLKKIRGFFSY